MQWTWFQVVCGFVFCRFGPLVLCCLKRTVQSPGTVGTGLWIPPLGVCLWPCCLAHLPLASLICILLALTLASLVYLTLRVAL